MSITRHRFRDTLPLLSTFLLIVLFVYAALSKLLDFGHFRHQLANQHIPYGFAALLAYALPTAEITAVALLLFQKTHFAGLLTSFLLMLLFSGYIGMVLLGFWERVPCSCGGILQHLSWKSHFVFNLFFLALSVFSLSEDIKKTTVPGSG